MTTPIPPPPGPHWQRGSKPKNLSQTMRRLLEYARPIRHIYVIIIVAGVLVTLLSVIGPIYLGNITDYAADCIESGTVVNPDEIVGTAVLLIAIYAVCMLLEWLRTRLEWTYEERLGNALRKDMSRKVSRISVGQLDKMQIGDIVSRFVNDSDTLRHLSIECITRTIESVIMLIGCIAIMIWIDWRLALTVLIPTLAGFLIMRGLVKMSQKYYRAQSRNLGKMNALVEETYRNLNVINIFNGIDEIKGRFDVVNRDLFKASLISRLTAGLMPEIIGFVNNLGYVMVCIVGSLLILDGSATFGTLVAFIVYVKLCNRPLLALSNSLGGIQEVGAAAERTFEFLDAPEMEVEDDTVELPNEIKGEVVFKDVCFSYVPGTEVIHDFNLKVSPGHRIAIVGPTGAGKTTISNLLLRYYDPDSGFISLDGIDIGDLHRQDVRRLFSVVLQDTWLFKGTIRQNLVFGADEIPDEKLMEVCEAVGLGHFIKSQPEGLDTYLDNPAMLSSGQKQQMTIARAIIKNAPLLIMDEATSSVDTRTEHAIQKAMDELMRDRTSFVIAHRLSTIKSADLIIVIRKGEIIEQGTHEELIAKGGFYRSLYDSQFEFCE